jgi:hypothetical protein
VQRTKTIWGCNGRRRRRRRKEVEEEEEEDCPSLLCLPHIRHMILLVSSPYKNMLKEKSGFDFELPNCTVSHPRRQQSSYSPP